MNFHHIPKTRSPWPTLLGFKIIIENTYSCIIFVSCSPTVAKFPTARLGQLLDLVPPYTHTKSRRCHSTALQISYWQLLKFWWRPCTKTTHVSCWILELDRVTAISTRSLVLRELPLPPLDNIRIMVIVWRLRGNIIRTAMCWIVWHNVRSLQHTYMSSSYRSNRLGLSHWDAYAVRRGGCLELYYCNMVEWFGSGVIQAWSRRPILVSFSALTLLVWSSGL